MQYASKCGLCVCCADILQIYHPNIDTDGKVCLNILRADWMPVLNLGSVVFGLLTLFLVITRARRCCEFDVRACVCF
jgi:ubiquitin-protein ligase